MIRSFLVAGLLAPLAAQGWSVTAYAPVAGQAQAIASFPAQTTALNVGPVNTGVFLAANSTTAFTQASAHADWNPSVVGQTAPVAFGTNVTAGVISAGHLFGYADVAATVDYTLHAPSAIAGRLNLRCPGAGVAPWESPWLRIDVGADGTIEAETSPSGNPVVLNLAASIPAAGLTIRVTYQAMAISWGSSWGPATVWARVEFFPGEPAVSPWSFTGAGATLAIDQPNGGVVTLSMSPIQQTPLLIAFGGQALNVALLPTVTQLVSTDVWHFGSAITLPLPSLPPGTTLFAQGLVADSLGVLRSTNSVRAFWP